MRQSVYNIVVFTEMVRPKERSSKGREGWEWGPWGRDVPPFRAPATRSGGAL